MTDASTFFAWKQAYVSKQVVASPNIGFGKYLLILHILHSVLLQLLSSIWFFCHTKADVQYWIYDRCAYYDV